MLTVSRNHATQSASMPKTQIMASSKPPVIQTASGALPVCQYAVASLPFYLIFVMLLVGYFALTLVGSLIVTMVRKISDWMFRDFPPNSTAPFRFHVNKSSSPVSLEVFSFTPSGSSPRGPQSVCVREPEEESASFPVFSRGFVDSGPRAEKR